MSDERPRPTLPAPEQIRRVAKQLRDLTPFQATQAVDRILSVRMRRTIAACLDELARLRADPSLARERRLEERADALAILATSRRLPLAAVEAAVRRAEETGSRTIPVAEIRRALARTEES